LSDAGQGVGESKNPDNGSKCKSKLCYIIWRKICEAFRPFRLITDVGFFTAILAVVAGLQWHTLDKTDATLRAGQRAFVFVKTPGNWTVAKMVGDEARRAYFVELGNNGNSQTKNLTFSLYCPRPNVFERIDPITANKKPEVVAPRMLGPKQTIGAGICSYGASELERVRSGSVPLFIALRVIYNDIFDNFHVTEYCAILGNFGDGDFKALATIPTNDTIPCDVHNCADDECKKQR
jgi:hypothetical protein